MVSLKVQKRLAASIFKCGQKRVWLDPNEINEISLANARMNIRILVKDGYVVKKPMKIHSKWHHRQRHKAKAEGRHSGQGKRKGTREARMPSKLWMRRIRVLRRLLHKYRQHGKIDKHLYHEMYMRVKGNVFRNKRVVAEIIHKSKAEQVRGKQLLSHIEAKRTRESRRRVT